MSDSDSRGEKQGTQTVIPGQSLLGQTDIDDHRIKPGTGTLDTMNEMPNDVLLEIFSQVEPIDLFHISRATKTLRDLITKSNSRYVWKRVFDNKNGSTRKPPPCPEGVKPTHYANLLFGRNCQICGSENGDLVHWAGRLRFCVQCADEQLRDVYQRNGDPIIPLCSPCRIKSIRDFKGGFFVLEAEYLRHSRALNECDGEEAELEYKRQANMSRAGRLRLGFDIDLWNSDS
ncbi:hypothetical protein M413DRAFT_437933 [Hebeloma cylindrosporum]|uniref:F-box domain-containing protein n=1 Tax=Hebeloma cylindrosporum TaxID=76867 RepID=A0A0C3CX79_HEBCY|nr:hypothetical protein M413DRAFT_437933 [Hebeloma cylindrosporum h7]